MLDKRIEQWLSERNGIERNLFGNERLDVSSSFYENFPTRDKPKWLTSLDGVEHISYFKNKFEFPIFTNLEAFWQKAFIYKTNLKWYHLMVSTNGWEKLILFYYKYYGDIFVLPYWCLCSGGLKHHRHMIIVTNEYYNIDSFEKTFRREEAIYKAVLLNDPLHLANVIQYVSGRRSQSKNPDSPLGTHYCINKPVIPRIQVFYSILVPGGYAWYQKEAMTKHTVCYKNFNNILNVLGIDKTSISDKKTKKMLFGMNNIIFLKNGVV